MPEADMTIPEHRSSIHLEYLNQALASGQEGDWHDFKRGLFTQKEKDELRKDLVALANTPGSPYNGYGYIILGVEDDGTVCGCQGSEAKLSEDGRSRQIGQLVENGIAPYIDTVVEEHVIGGKRVHLVVVPPAASGKWHMVTADSQSGYWIRRVRASHRPTYEDVEAHITTRIQATVQPVQDALGRLEQRLGLLRQDLQDLQQERHPEAISAAQHARTAFLTPDRTLLRLIRQEANTFLERRADLEARLLQVDPDVVVQYAQARTPDRIARLRELFEALEEVTRPLVETVASIQHDVEHSERVMQGVQELSDVITRTSYHEFTLPPFMFALRAYPALLYLHGVAVTSSVSGNWSVLSLVLHHRQWLPRINQPRRRVALASLLSQRGPLDEVARLVEPVPVAMAAATRMERLLLQSDWVGHTLPVLDRQAVYARGEALLTFGYLTAARSFPVAQPPSFPAVWWRYLNADAILYGTLSQLLKGDKQWLRGDSVEALAEAFDRMEKPGHHLTTSASEVVRQLSRRAGAPA